MSKIKLIGLLLFSVIIANAQSGPKFEIEGGETINTGTHTRGKEVNYEIKFRNVGDADLKINGVQATCGCSSALSSNDVIPPGESGTIKFTFNGQGFGQVSKTIVVSTNETETPTHTVMLTMNMLDPVTLTPQSIITEGKVGEELNQTATVLNSNDKDLVINEITSNTPVIKIESDKMQLASGEAASLKISIKIYEESAINAAVIIKTSEGDFQIPVMVDVKSQ